MFKKLLAIGLLAVTAGLAQAQSSISIYGVLDESVVNQSGNGLNNTNMNSSTTQNSLLGFRGMEKLGHGYGVGFNLEAGINLSNGSTGNSMSGVGGTTAQNNYVSSSGTSSVFNRQANIQADVPVGSFKLGRQYTPSFIAVSSGGADALGIASGGIAQVMSTLGGVNNRYLTGSTTSPLNPDTLSSTYIGNPGLFSNGIGFKTYEFAGFTGHAFVGINQSSSGITGDNYLNQQAIQDITVSYRNGPVFGLLGYQNVNDNSGAQYSTGKLATLGYDVTSSVTVKATYYGKQFGSCSNASAGGNCMNKSMSISAAGVTTAATYAPVGTAYGDDYDSYALGVSWKATDRVRVAGQVTQTNDTNVTANKNTMYTLYSDYKFSPRTSVYALYSYVQNNGQSNFSPIFGLSATTTNNGQDIQAVALGLKHTF